MTTIVAFGFVIGMKHALEADHLAAVATLATRTRSLRAAMLQGTTWGLGHTLTLLLVAGGVRLLGLTLRDSTAAWLELGVGVMLIGLAIDVGRRLRAGEYHVHAHAHSEGTRHFLAHHHEPTDAPGDHGHAHAHDRVSKLRALLVGSAHGMAGSSALALLSVQAVASPWVALLYIALFGLGSMAGMAVLSIAMAAPLHLSARRLDRTYLVLCGAAGVLSWIVGVMVIASSVARLW